VPPDQSPPVATVTDPARVTLSLLAQTVCGAPAFTVGAGVMVSVKLLLTGLQVPFPVELRVRVIGLLVLSAAEGI
jgi:hypothetical protein